MIEKTSISFPLVVRSCTGLALLFMVVTLFAPVSKEAAQVLFILFRISVLVALISVVAELIFWRKSLRVPTLVDSLCCVLLLLVWFFAKASSY